MKIDDIKTDIKYLEQLYSKLIQILPSFYIADDKILPYGLKPHTRSISWLAEQVINQQMKHNAAKLGLDDVAIDFPDTCLHDSVIQVKNKKYFVNIKIHKTGGKENNNDIAAVEKLFEQYSSDPGYDIIYVCLGISFDKTKISFDKNYLQIFSAQFLPIYVNPRNDKIQAFYAHDPIYRNRAEFLKLLQQKSKSIVLKSGKNAK